MTIPCILAVVKEGLAASDWARARGTTAWRRSGDGSFTELTEYLREEDKHRGEGTQGTR
jgi:hypothetical protein